MLWIVGLAAWFGIWAYRSVRRYARRVGSRPDTSWVSMAAVVGALIGLMIALVIGNNLPYHYSFLSDSPVAVFEPVATDAGTVLLKGPEGKPIFLARNSYGKLFIWEETGRNLSIVTTGGDRAHLDDFDAHFNSPWGWTVGILSKDNQYRLYIPDRSNTFAVTMRM